MIKCKCLLIGFITILQYANEISVKNKKSLLLLLYIPTPETINNCCSICWSVYWSICWPICLTCLNLILLVLLALPYRPFIHRMAACNYRRIWILMEWVLSLQLHGLLTIFPRFVPDRVCTLFWISNLLGAKKIFFPLKVWQRSSKKYANLTYYC